MASILKDAAVVEHVGKQVEKAKAAARKQALADLKAVFTDHSATLGEDKVALKAVKTFHTHAQNHLKAAPAAE